jgi:hypothetical protein
VKVWPFFFALAGCATPAVVVEAPPPPPPIPPPPPPSIPLPRADLELDPQTLQEGELPWWYALKAGTYKYGSEVMVMATGRSVDHHHVAEGFLHAKVTARLAVRKAAESVAFAGNLPEPELVDLFITRDRKFLALFGLKVPPEAKRQGSPAELIVPEVVRGEGRHRVGRHVYEGEQHLFLECEIEGPIANPDWGRTRAAAFLYRPEADRKNR